MKDIDKGTRLANYLIDLIAIFLLWYIVISVFQSYDSNNFIFYLIMFSYYLVFEGSTGQTLGKLVTKTKVVNKDGTNPKFFKILMRSFWRIIPIDAFSYLFGNELGMHDLLSSTKLSKKTNANNAQQRTVLKNNL